MCRVWLLRGELCAVCEWAVEGGDGQGCVRVCAGGGGDGLVVRDGDKCVILCWRVTLGNGAGLRSQGTTQDKRVCTVSYLC